MEIETVKNDVGMSINFVSLKNVIDKPLSGEWGDGEGEINVIRTTNFTNDGKLDLTNVVKRNVDNKKIIQKQLLYGDTIIEKSGGSPSQPVGRVVYFDQNQGVYLCNNFTSVIRGKSNIDKRYLFWFLFNNHLTQNTLRYQNKTTGIINLQLERYIDDLQIPLPPLPIQRRIAEILDAADALKRKDQQLLKKYDELAQAIFMDMFGDPVKNEKGWEVKKLGDCCVVGSSVRVFVDELVSYGIPFLRGQEIGAMSNGEKINPTLFITKEHYNILSTQSGVPKIGDLLMPSICPDGRIFQVEDNAPFYFKDGRVLWIKTNEQYFISTFLKFVLKEKFLRNYSNIASGSTFAELKIFALKDLELPIPPISLQIEFAKLINVVVNQRDSSRCAEKLGESLFNTLLQKAFKGELITE